MATSGGDPELLLSAEVLPSSKFVVDNDEINDAVMAALSS